VDVPGRSASVRAMASARRAEEKSLNSRTAGLVGIENIMFDASGCGADW
jgi:hypothetical protein